MGGGGGEGEESESKYSNSLWLEILTMTVSSV